MSFSRNLLVAILGESKEGGGVTWQLVTRLRKLNIGGYFAVVMNCGGDGATITNEARDEIEDLKELTSDNFRHAQREYEFWMDLINTQEGRMERQAQRIIAENPPNMNPNIIHAVRIGEAGVNEPIEDAQTQAHSQTQE